MGHQVNGTFLLKHEAYMEGTIYNSSFSSVHMKFRRKQVALQQLQAQTL